MKPHAVDASILPLRLIFWGGLLLVIDFHFLQTVNGEGFRFDLFNDAVGALMILVGVCKLRAIDVSDGYRTLMTLVVCVSAFTLLDAVQAHVITRDPWELTPWLQNLLGLAELGAILAFCVAMRGLCGRADLRRAAQSFRTTTLLFILIYLVPLGLFRLAVLAALARQESFNVDLGPAALLLIPVFMIPAIHLFVSTSRMEADARAAPGRIALG
ncbi:MAG: hypothetical protein CMJ83_20860 [Planctomycetes bacterium]|nr:hypothetical protein [Planctomycetota bacterium]